MVIFGLDDILALLVLVFVNVVVGGWHGIFVSRQGRVQGSRPTNDHDDGRNGEKREKRKSRTGATAPTI
jgi:hypothetical protein